MTQLAILGDFRGPESPFRSPYLVLKTDIMHIVASEKGKPPERRGRKTTGLRAEAYDSGAAKMNTERGNINTINGRAAADFLLFGSEGLEKE